MEAISRISPKLSANQIRYIYNWRLYFQVTTLADLCNAKGDQVLDIYLQQPTALNGQHLRTDRTSNLHWPMQFPPESSKTFKLWVRCIRLCFLNGTGRKLRKSLGSWVTSPDQLSSNWTGYMSPDQNTFIHRNTNGLTTYSTISSSTPGTTTFTQDGNHDTTSTIPSMFVPIDFDTINNRQVKVYHTNRIMRQSIPDAIISPDNDIQQAIANASMWQRCLLQHFRIHDLQHMIQSLTSIDTKIYVVSDGGLKDQKGAFGVSAGTSESELFRIEGPAPGYSEHSNSYRSEAYGLLAGLNFLCMFLQTYHIEFTSTRKLYMFCDNLSLVNCIQRILLQQTYPRMFLRSDSDVILQIANDIKWLTSANLTIILEHVKGHQDDTIEYHALSRESQLNVDADGYATNYIREGPIISYVEFPANPISLYINDNVMNRDLKREMRNSSRSPELRIYMISRFSWNQNTPDLIWWDVHGSTIKSYSSPDRRRIRKLIFGWLPTCRRLKKYDKALSDLCPSCNTSVEHNDHLFTCQCRSRIIVKNKWLEAFDKFLSNDRYTPPIIRMLFFNHMISFFSFETVVMPTMIPGDIHQAMQAQSAIGWKQLVFGRLAFPWGNIITNHLHEQNVDNREMSSLVWGRRITRLLFDIGLQQWNQKNMDGHLLTQNRESSLTRIRLFQQIEHFQTIHHDVPHQHRDFIYRPMEILEVYTNSNLRSWLKLANNLVRATRNRGRATVNIMQYLIPTPIVLNPVGIT